MRHQSRSMGGRGYGSRNRSENNQPDFEPTPYSSTSRGQWPHEDGRRGGAQRYGAYDTGRSDNYGFQDQQDQMENGRHSYSGQDYNAQSFNQERGSRSRGGYNRENSASGYEDSGYGSQNYNYGRENNYGSSRGRESFGNEYFGDQDRNRSGRSSFGSDQGTGFGQGEFGGGLRDREPNGREEYPRSHAGKGPKGYKRSDERVREDVSERLEADHHIDASDIEVQVKEGVVTLTGTVESRFAKRHAEEIIESLRGVKDVTNQITVQSQASNASSSTNSRSSAMAASGSTQNGSRTSDSDRDEETRNGKNRRQ